MDGVEDAFKISDCLGAFGEEGADFCSADRCACLRCCSDVCWKQLKKILPVTFLCVNFALEVADILLERSSIKNVRKTIAALENSTDTVGCNESFSLDTTNITTVTDDEKAVLDLWYVTWMFFCGWTGSPELLLCLVVCAHG